MSDVGERRSWLMIKEHFLIWIDILGFGNLAKELSRKTRMEERKIRNDFIQVLSKKIDLVEKMGFIVGKNYGEKDDWLLVTGSMNSAFKAICEILDHNTGYEDLKCIPLEIGIGVAEYDRWARFSGTELVTESSTIDILKTNIIRQYHEWYNRNHKGKTIKWSFLVFTETAHDRLEPLDKGMCRKIGGKRRKKGDHDIAYIIPHVERIKRKGKIFGFLRRIQHPESRLYDRIDQIYVPPMEYEEIRQTLEKDKIVFIVGTPEYGKTYTAVRLLWEYYNKGFEPVWIRGEEARQRVGVRERLREIERELKPGSIVYFEDPFGLLTYEGREILEREIGTIVDSILSVDNVRVIVTSREEVFKKFREEQSSFVGLEKFQKNLSIKKHSYSRRQRKEILILWAKSKGCRWLLHKKSRMMIEKSLENEGTLPTPLSIKDFVIATVNMTKISELRKKIEEKSMESTKSFAKEIVKMPDDKVLFLSLPLLSPLPVVFAASEYERILKEIGAKDPLNFREVLKWFEDDKVTVVADWLEFSHFSYLQAVRYLAFEDREQSKVYSNLRRLVPSLTRADSYVARSVVYAVADDFDKLPEDIGNLLIDLAKRESVAGDVARAVARNFDKLPDNIRNLLLELAKADSYTAYHVAKALRYDFGKLPARLRNKLLLSLSKREANVARQVVWTVAENFDKLPKDFENLLTNLAESMPFLAKDILKAVATYFDRIPRSVSKLLVDLSKDRSVAVYIARAVAENFDKLPDNIRNLLPELAKADSYTARSVAHAVADNFDKLPEDIGNLLIDLAKRESVAGSVAEAIARNFDKLPDNIRNLLLELAKADSDTAHRVLVAVSLNFRKIPREILDSIFKSKNPWSTVY